jgi:hypothetical protein
MYDENGRASILGDTSMSDYKWAEIELAQHGYAKLTSIMDANELLKSRLSIEGSGELPYSSILNQDGQMLGSPTWSDPASAQPFGDQWARIGRIDIGYNWFERAMMGIGDAAAQTNMKPTDHGIEDRIPGAGERAARVNGKLFFLDNATAVAAGHRDTYGDKNLMYRYDIYRHNENGSERVFV